jgi:hypothetical protein
VVDLRGGSVGAIVVWIILDRRRACPVCGKRPFIRVLDANLFAEHPRARPRYSVRWCSSCGARQVECLRGKQLLPQENWESLARRYAAGEWDSGGMPG